MPSISLGELFTTISSVFKQILASPPAKEAIASTASSSISISKFANPFGEVKARWIRSIRSSFSKEFSTKTLHLDNKALLTSKLGFSVVAPIRIILPFSTYGKNASCCALLKRWISSTNKIVFWPKFFRKSACFITSLISLIPDVTALKSTK